MHFLLSISFLSHSNKRHIFIYTLSDVTGVWVGVTSIGVSDVTDVWVGFTSIDVFDVTDVWDCVISIGVSDVTDVCDGITSFGVFLMRLRLQWNTGIGWNKKIWFGFGFRPFYNFFSNFKAIHFVTTFFCRSICHQYFSLTVALARCWTTSATSRSWSRHSYTSVQQPRNKKETLLVLYL